MDCISFIVPVYNEEDTIGIFHKEICHFFETKIDSNKYTFELVFVNDGSIDKTPLILNELFKNNKNITVVNFSRNFGKENALFAGLEHVSNPKNRGGIIIPIDVDLQDPLHVIATMLQKYEEGYDVVLAQRVQRDKDSFLKKFTAEQFYKVYNSISKTKLEPNVGDFRLMTKKVVNEILKLPENQLFMKGVFNWVGFRTAIVQYNREERIAGKTKFNGYKLWNLALEGITSFSTIPIRIWLYIGSFIAFLSFILGIKVLIEKFFFGIEENGYASLIVSVFFIGGVQLIGIGILGEYIGRIYMEVKRRPKYIVENLLKNEEK
ncbi:MAG: glycosyltransferase family 2 protein [Cruoricaptor ignavus]|nr:glycosyltransferase family 2 protein [Cruoricaptor ignavus]